MADNGKQDQKLKLDNEKGPGKKKFIIIGAAALLLIIIGVVAFLFLKGGSEEAAPENAETTEATVNKVKEINYLDLKKPFVIQLNLKPRHRIIQIKVQVTTASVDDLNLATVHEPLIKNAISSTLYSYQTDPEIFNQIEGRIKVKESCLKAVQEALMAETGKPLVDRVLFTDFVMQ